MYAKEIEKRFTYHPPKPGQAERYERIRDGGRKFAELVVDLCPDSSEREIAIRRIEEAVMWSNAAISRRE